MIDASRVPAVELVPVDSENWRDVTALEVKASQADFVNHPAHYLCLCNYGKLWNPLAVVHNRTVAGFMMWALDDEDGSCWLGGITIDKARQGQGFGTAAIRAAIEKLSREQGYSDFALSYESSNTGARRVYAAIGFLETGEMEDDEVVARYSLNS